MLSSTKLKSVLDYVVDPNKSILPIFIFACLTFLILYPVSVFPGQLVIGRPFDNVFESIGYLDWYKRALIDQRISPLFNPDIFYPGGWDLRFSVLPPLFPILLAPLTAVLGSVATYNLIIIVSTIIAAFGVYSLHKAMGGALPGGIFAGLLYGFYPNRQIYMAGFLNLLLASIWLPWMLLGVYKAVYTPQKRTRWLAFTGLCYALSIASAWQYTYISTLAILLYGGVLVGSNIAAWRDWVKPLTIFIGTILVVAGPWLIIGFQGQKSVGQASKFPLSDLIATSPSLERFILPSAMNPFTWKLTREIFSEGINENSMIFFGYITVILVFFAFLRWRPWDKPEWALLVLTVGTLLFMMGPFLKWMNQPIMIPVPDLVASVAARLDLLGQDNSIRLPMPAFVVYKLVPPFETFHHFGRIGLVSALGLGIFAGLGLTKFLQSRTKLTGFAIGLFCITFLLLEINMQPHQDITSVMGMQRDVDAWLAAHEAQNVIIEYPLDYASKSQSLYHIITHQQKVVNSYALPPKHYASMLPTLAQWPDEAALKLLREIGVDYILVDAFQGEKDFETEKLPELQAISQLTFVGRFSRHLDREDVPRYLFGHIYPRVGLVKDVYVFRLDYE